MRAPAHSGLTLRHATKTVSVMRKVILVGIVAAGAIFTVLANTEQQAQPETQQATAGDLIVHEWGVWVRSSTSRGTMWSSPETMVEQLPPFVRLVKNEYTPKRQDHGWDKPVIHLYGPEGLAVKVEIATTQGHPTAYFPEGTLVPKTVHVKNCLEMAYYTLTDCFGIEWKGTLSNEPKGALLEVDPKHWWAQVRKVPSAYIHTENDRERFLFYEATAFQEPAIVASISKDQITLRLSPPLGQRRLPPAKRKKRSPVGSTLVIINDGLKHYAWHIDEITADKPVSRKRSDLLSEALPDIAILAAARAQWEAFGITKEEASAIVKSWRSDLLDTPGFLVISRMPPPLYEKMFPLTVTPKPKEIVRVGMVFDTVPGSDDRLSWLPSSQLVFKEWARGLEDPDSEVRAPAAAKLARQGDLVRPLLKSLIESGAPRAQSEARDLLAKLRPIKVEAPLMPTLDPKSFYIPIVPDK